MNDKLPKKLYQYFGNTSFALHSLKNKVVHMSYPVFFNDPFDSTFEKVKLSNSACRDVPVCKAIFEFMMTDSYFIENYLDDLYLSNFNIDFFNNLYFNLMTIEDAIKAFWWCIDGHPYDIKKGVRYNKDFIPASNYLLDNKEKIQNQAILNYSYSDKLICCFSESKDSNPMWAYYGGNHSGIVLEYDTSLFDKKTKDNLFQIDYRTDRKAFSACITKSKQWEHEKEWRLIMQDGEDEITVDDYYERFCKFDYVSGVYFGARYNFNNTYKEIVNAVNESKNLIKLYKANVSEDSFNLIFTEYYQNKKENENV